MNKLQFLSHRFSQASEYYRQGGVSEVISRSLMLSTRKICTHFLRSAHSDSIPVDTQPILYIDSTNSTNGMGIGDSIGRIPTLQAIAKKYRTQVDVLCEPNKYFIFKGQEWFREVITSGSGVLSHFNLLNILNAQDYSWVILIRPDWTYIGLLPVIRNLPKLVLSQPGNSGVNRTEELYDSAYSQGFIDKDFPETPAPRILPSKTSVSRIPKSSWLVRIVLYTEAKSALRSYGDWRGIISDIRRTYSNAEIVLLGESKKILIPIGIPIYDLRGKTPSLLDMMAEIQACNIFIWADGGMTHLSMALNKPTINISSVSPITEFIQLEQQRHVIPIVAPCPEKEICGTAKNNKGSRCITTKQSMFDQSRIPPCMSDTQIRKRILKSIETILSKNPQ